MSFNENEGTYVYQGNSLIVPEDTPDSLIGQGTARELVDAAFGAFLENADDFSVPALDGEGGGALKDAVFKGGVIRALTLGEGEIPAGWKALPLRQVLNIITGGTFAECTGASGRILRSFHLSQWRRDSRFCGRCGAENRNADSGELARQCTACGRLEYPRISPAVITVITNDSGEALLAHNKNFVPGIYSLVAGFAEAGESLEAAVAREIKEEVNIEVKDIRYIRSQPWPFPNSLMLGFSARYSGGEVRPDGIEIEDAKWFSRDAMPDLPGSSSVSRYLIDLWREKKL